MNQSVAVILSSAFDDLAGLGEPMTLETPFGLQVVYPYHRADRLAFAIFRHGHPHRWLPNQIKWRAQSAALKMLNVGALLITSSVGVLRRDVPLNTPLVVSDLLMPDNRLPDGSLCTMFVEPSPEQGHLVLQEGLFNAEIAQTLVKLGAQARPLCFVYAPGPRTKTPAENRYWASAGGDVNSMSLGPEVVLANELEIPCAGLVVGHKYSHPDISTGESAQITESLDDSKKAFQGIVTGWLSTAAPVEFKNTLFRF